MPGAGPAHGYIRRFMAQSVVEALLKAGVIRPEDAPETQQEMRWRERQEREAAEIAARMAEPPPPRWEPDAGAPSSA